MVVVKFLVFVSEVVSIFSKILTWIIGGQKDTFAPPTQLLGGACPGCPPKSTPMGLGIRRAASLALPAFLASAAGTRITQASMLGESFTDTDGVMETLSLRWSEESQS